MCNMVKYSIVWNHIEEYIVEPVKSNIPTSTPCEADAIIMIPNFQMRKIGEVKKHRWEIMEVGFELPSSLVSKTGANFLELLNSYFCLYCLKNISTLQCSW